MRRSLPTAHRSLKSRRTKLPVASVAQTGDNVADIIQVGIYLGDVNGYVWMSLLQFCNSLWGSQDSKEFDPFRTPFL